MARVGSNHHPQKWGRPKAAQMSITTRSKTHWKLWDCSQNNFSNTPKCTKIVRPICYAESITTKERGQNDSLRKNARAGL